jgi:hypothetical protein
MVTASVKLDFAMKEAGLRLYPATTTMARNAIQDAAADANPWQLTLVEAGER